MKIQLITLWNLKNNLINSMRDPIPINIINYNEPFLTGMNSPLISHRIRWFYLQRLTSGNWILKLERIKSYIYPLSSLKLVTSNQEFVLYIKTKCWKTRNLLWKWKIIQDLLKTTEDSGSMEWITVTKKSIP